MNRRPRRFTRTDTLVPYTTPFRSALRPAPAACEPAAARRAARRPRFPAPVPPAARDRRPAAPRSGSPPAAAPRSAGTAPGGCGAGSDTARRGSGYEGDVGAEPDHPAALALVVHRRHLDGLSPVAPVTPVLHTPQPDPSLRF